MPEIAENLDRNRLKEVRVHAIKAARFWLDMHAAAGNVDPDGCRGIYKHIRDETVAVSDLLKALGAEKSNA